MSWYSSYEHTTLLLTLQLRNFTEILNYGQNMSILNSKTTQLRPTCSNCYSRLNEEICARMDRLYPIFKSTVADKVPHLSIWAKIE